MSGFLDRTAAGKALADELADRGYDDPVVLALPRGGVPVGIELVRALHAPMDLVMVRKIGVPAQPELAAGAIVNGDDPQTVVNEEVLAHAGLSRDEVDRLGRAQLDEIRRRRQTYLRDRRPVPVKGRTAIVVDDGIATGATMRASLRAVRRRRPAWLVLAVPVAPPETCEALRKEVDEAICLLTPSFFGAIGAYYSDFGQTSDDEVIALMDEAARIASGGTGNG
ncbi:phosphoribosyltransferase [Roseovarius salinarum]|uniref:phosphoribosyltransferase n=1 Tax=Roseovarius salinarum TaxID=1981892 RepID=UPI000C33FD45|nr:phosphoribosyltransferase [Roseovarius salinarum]